MSEMESKVTASEAIKAVERCLAPSKWDAERMVITGCVEMHHLGPSLAAAALTGDGAVLGLFELELDKAVELIEDEDTCDIAWEKHELFGECLAISHQCPNHPENPMDRITLRYISVRRTQ